MSERMLQECADYLYADRAALTGRTLESVFDECERCGATVYWGFWTESELQQLIP